MALSNLPSGKSRHRRAPMAEINVTPMVDVMLVLLIIFMVTAPLLVTGVPVNLPESSAKALDPEKEPVQLSLDAEGKLFLDDKPVPMADLKTMFVKLGFKDARTYIQSGNVVFRNEGKDPAKFTDDDFNAAADELQKQLDSGQIRQVTGNDYLTALENKDVVAVIGWSGDVAALGDEYAFTLPESGGTIWTDNMLIPAMAAHQKNAEKIMDFYYDPANAATVAAYVQYICPVEGAKEAIAKIDPTLVDNQLIFPSAETLSKVTLFMTLTPEQQTKYEQQFQQLIGN